MNARLHPADDCLVNRLLAVVQKQAVKGSNHAAIHKDGVRWDWIFG
jgi:hypothetical protein